MAFMQLANMSLKEQFEQIESLRKQKKLSVDSLCFSSKVHQSTYYRIKKNKVSPKYETLQKLVKALND
jgi:transcriptional regulator with XRE-family HTH domain